MINRIAALLLLIPAAACSSDSYKLAKDAAVLSDFKQTAKLETRWDKDVGSAGNNILLPAVTKDAVYVANARGKVSRLNRQTGNRVWRIDCGFTVAAGVGAGGGLVLVGGVKGELAAFSEDGKLRWQTQVSSEVLDAPLIAEGIVVVRTADGRVSGLSAADGKRLWLYERATPALIVRSHAGEVIRGDTVYAGMAGGKLAAIGLGSGIVIWEAIVAQPRGNTELERISDITSAPVADEERVCAVAFQGRIACFGLAQGNLLWSRDISSDAGLALHQNFLYVTDDKGVVSALDKSSGSSVWKNDKLSLRRTSAPFVLGDHIVVGDYEGYLHVLKAEDGSFEARLKTDGSPIMAAPVELDGGFLAQTANGRLYSVALH